MRRILLVEDDSTYCYAAQRALQKAGYEVAAFESTLIAWDHVGRGAQLDLLITDLVFPQGQPSGIALARSAGQHHPGLPVIFITAYDDAVTVAEGDRGRVLRKPIELDVLMASVQEMLDKAKPE